MALSSSKYPVCDRKQFFKSFPHLTPQNHKPTSRATPEQSRPEKPYYIYNCFAFVVGDRKRFWWPGDPDSYWPRDGADESLQEMIELLSTEFGYEPCADGTFEPGVQKVAIFAKDNLPVHIAIQPSSRQGTWQSKMGYNVDMEHDLRAVETWDIDDHQDEGYGRVVQFMKLVRKKAKRAGR